MIYYREDEPKRFLYSIGLQASDLLMGDLFGSPDLL